MHLKGLEGCVVPMPTAGEKVEGRRFKKLPQNHDLGNGVMEAMKMDGG